MAYLVSDLINEAAQEDGITYPGTTLNNSEQTRALSILNAMVDRWNAERIRIYGLTTTAFSLTPSTANYTLGSGGTLNAPYPNFIQGANILASNLSWALDLINEQEFAAINDRTTVGLPTKMYDDGSYPLRNISLWPAPGASFPTLEIISWTTIAQFASTSTAIALPPAYQAALKFNLAVQMAESFGVTAQQATVAKAADALAAMQSRNAQMFTGAISPDVVTGAPARGLPQQGA